MKRRFDWGLFISLTCFFVSMGILVFMWARP